MSFWSNCVMSLWATYWSAILAELAHLRMRDDGAGAFAFAWISAALLVAGLGLQILARKA